MKEKKGISLIVLVITIIVILILTGLVVVNGKDAYVEAQKTTLKTEIAQIETLTKNYYTRRSGNLDFVTIELTVPSAYIEQFEGESIVSSKVTMYVIDLNKIDAEEVTYGNLEDGENDRYLYSTTTGKVYYEKGLDIDGKIYYRIDK